MDLHFDKAVKREGLDDAQLWDLLVIGGGPAGLNGALYAYRKGLKVALISQDIGGQLHNTTEVDNYLGFQMIQGPALSDQFLEHVQSFDVPTLVGVTLKAIERDGQNYRVVVDNGQTFETKTVLLTMGGSSRKLGVEGEEPLANRGVSYCTTCDAPFFRNRHVVVAGGGNSAAEAVLDLAAWADKITVVHRSQWRADQVLLDKFKAIPNLTIHLESQILKVEGDTKMTGLTILDKTKNETWSLKADGLFIEIGTVPNSTLVHDLVECNEQGEIIVDGHHRTSLPGLYAAGDVTDNPFKQIIIATAEGAKAALAINHYLTHEYKEETQ